MNSYVLPYPNLFMLCSLNYLHCVYKPCRGRPADYLRLFYKVRNLKSNLLIPFDSPYVQKLLAHYTAFQVNGVTTLFSKSKSWGIIWEFLK